MKSYPFTEKCDRVMAFSFYALIFFLPISTALVETFASLALATYFVKRFFIFFSYLKAHSFQPNNGGGWSKFLIFLESFKPVPSCINIPMGVYILACFMSSINSFYPPVSFKGFFFKLLQGTFLFFNFIESINTPKRLKIFLCTFFASVLLVTTNGIYQYFMREDFIYHHPFHDGRVTSSFRHANDFGGYLVFLLPVLLCLLLVSKRKALSHGLKGDFDLFSRLWMRGVMALLFLFSGFCLGMTFSRGAWVAVLAGLSIVVIKHLRWLPLFVILSGGFWFIISLMSLQPRFSDIFVRHNFFWDSGRLSFWSQAWQMIRDYPILGVGLNTYTTVGQKYHIAWGGYAHNCYIQMAVEIGVVGLLSFLSIIFILFRKSLRNLQLIQDPFSHNLLLGSLGGLLGFLVHSFFDTNFYPVQLGNYLWIIIGIIIVIQKFIFDLKTKS